MGYCLCHPWKRGDPFVLHDPFLREDICIHCGGIIRYEDDEKGKKSSDSHISKREYFSRQARSCSIRQDYSTAIEFYKEALKNSFQNREKCEMLSAIADEYEAIGDYDSAEFYWNRCCEVDLYDRYDTVYIYLAKKGDFLYRRGRYGEAISLYEEALNELNGVKDSQFNSLRLRYYARIVYYIIDSYDQLGKDNQKKKYHDELRHAIAKFRKGQYHGPEFTAHYLCETAWNLSELDSITDEALMIIDSAIEIHPDCPADYYNRKAIILDRGWRFDEALKYYDKALSKGGPDETVLKNKAFCIREKLKRNLLFREVESGDLELIDEAMEMLPEGYDNSEYLFTKSQVLGQLGEPVKAKFCSALSAKNYDKVDKAERQLKRLRSSQIYINITGIHFYKGFEPFKEGTIVDLIREPDNPHDRDAIRVEIDGETVGYVANSMYTVIKEVKSATAIRDTDSTQAKVQFILFDEWVIARLI